MAEVIKVRNVPAQHIGVINSAPCPEMNIVAKEITENGRYEARTEGVTGFDPVIVNVPSREEIGYENGYAAGYGKGSTDGYADALAKRTELEVTANGEYIPEGESTGFSKVSVNLPSDTDTIDGLIDGTLSGAYRNDRVTRLEKYGFAYKPNITSLDLPNVTSLSERAIYGNKNLVSLRLDSYVNEKSTDGMYAIADNNALLSVYMPNAKSIQMYCFYMCKNLTDVCLPLAATIGLSSFGECNKLTKVDLPSATKLVSSTFASCYSLTTLILRSPTVCVASSTSTFLKCYHLLGTVDATYNPEGLKDGYIYVPKNLVEDYKVATNWSTYADQFRAIEDYPEITGG